MTIDVSSSAALRAGAGRYFEGQLDRRQAGDAPEARPACGSGKQGAYDTPLHVFALFLILIISTLACGFPLFKRRMSKGRRPSKIIFYSQHFGTGVLIATAFVHLLPTAFLSLTDPCLPPFFNKGYEPLAGLIAMVFAISVVGLESYLTTRGAGHSHSHDLWDDEDVDAPDAPGDSGDSNGNGNLPKGSSGLSGRRGTSRHRPDDIVLREVGPSTGLIDHGSPVSETTPMNGAADDDDRPMLGKDYEVDCEDGCDSERQKSAPPVHSHARNRSRSQSLAQVPTHDHTSEATPVHRPDSETQKRMMLQCLLLEAGILFHSVFIGMALSVATGPAFVVFLVAIGFHQAFEGLALGSRIAAIHFPRASWRPWLMVLAYGTTTPLGQAIGLVVHNLYDPQSQTGLLMVGIMNAISSGLLLFAGLVQLLAEDFLTEKSYKTLYGQRRRNAFLAVASGATLMALVGAFA